MVHQAILDHLLRRFLALAGQIGKSAIDRREESVVGLCSVQSINQLVVLGDEMGGVLGPLGLFQDLEDSQVGGWMMMTTAATMFAAFLAVLPLAVLAMFAVLPFAMWPFTMLPLAFLAFPRRPVEWWTGWMIRRFGMLAHMFLDYVKNSLRLWVILEEVQNTV